MVLHGQVGNEFEYNPSLVFLGAFESRVSHLANLEVVEIYTVYTGVAYIRKAKCFNGVIMKSIRARTLNYRKCMEEIEQL